MSTAPMVLSKITRHQLGDYARVMRFHFQNGIVSKLLFPNGGLSAIDTPIPHDRLTEIEKSIVACFPSLTIADRYNSTISSGAMSDADRVRLEMMAEQGVVHRY